MSRMEEIEALAHRRLIEEKWIKFVQSTPLAHMGPAHDDYQTSKRMFYEGARATLEAILFDAADGRDAEPRINAIIDDLTVFMQTELIVRQMNNAKPHVTH